MADSYRLFLEKAKKEKTHTPQSMPVPGREAEMVKNRAGGYAFKMEPFAALRRALILGTSENTFYASASELTKEFAELVAAAIELDPVKAAEQIVYAADRRALKQAGPILALTLLGASEKPEAKKAFREIFPKVIRIAPHFYTWLHFTRLSRGMGRLMLDCARDWFKTRDASALAYQFFKYTQRETYTARDVLRLVRPKPEDADKTLLYKLLVKGSDAVPMEEIPDSLSMVRFLRMLREEKMPAAEAIVKGRLSHEMVSSLIGQNKEAWKAVFEHMPVGALIRNLGSLTAKGIFDDTASKARVCGTLTNHEILRCGGVHPVSVFKAMKTYAAGHGNRGKLSWTPIAPIKDAVSKALELSFERSALRDDLRYGMFIDVSGSMNMVAEGFEGLATCTEAAAVMALVLARKVKDYFIVGFSSCKAGDEWNGNMNNGLFDLGVCASDSYTEALRKVNGGRGGTDCSLPFQYLCKKNEKVDVIICLTDNESWKGATGHTFQYLADYRKRINPDVKVVYLTMGSSKTTLVDPNDTNCLDIAGFSPDVCKAIEMFVSNYQAVSEEAE
jgi:60 kDa SS-A/Ro ribonucleoprotein